MASLLLFTLQISLYFCQLIVHYGVVTGKNVEAPVKTLCSRKCETSERNATDMNVPLYQCSCSPGCAVYGDCCFDSKYKDTSTQRKTDFVCLSLEGHGKYRAVSGCLPDRPSVFCSDGLGRLPPVTSRKTNITYANIFCATCNEDNANLDWWKVESSCSSELNGESGDNIKLTVSRTGNIWRVNEADGSKQMCKYHAHSNDFSFLTGLELRACTRDRKISQCSTTWSELPIAQLCRSYEDPIYFHNTAYRNSHCAECNYMDPSFADCMPLHVKTMVQKGMIDAKVAKFCQRRGSDTCIQTLSKGVLYPISSTFFNIREKSCVPEPGKKCCKGQAWNRNTGRCRNVSRQG